MNLYSTRYFEKLLNGKKPVIYWDTLKQNPTEKITTTRNTQYVTFK